MPRKLNLKKILRDESPFDITTVAAKIGTSYQNIYQYVKYIHPELFTFLEPIHDGKHQRPKSLVKANYDN